MRRTDCLFLLLPTLSIVLNSCGPTQTSTPTSLPPTLTSPPQGGTIVVSSTADSGTGTLRQALSDAHPGDTITFDRSAFPPEDPASIPVASELPWLSQGSVTIDASDAGVILDGSLAGGEWTPGLTLDSEWNTIRGLHIVHFTGAGIVLNEHAAHNAIGGDPDIGAGPLGQGNLSSANADGIGLSGAANNILTGNRIGTDVLGTGPLPNRYTGIFLMDGAQGNAIGPANTVAFNGESGIEIRPAHSTGNTITRNSIHDNGGANTYMVSGDALAPAPPIILDFNLHAGTAEGVTCPSCVVEVFSGEGGDAEVYEGTTTADRNGAFALMTSIPFRGPALRATATSSGGSTSTFSLPTSGDHQSWTLQQGNALHRSLLQARASGELEDNRVGTHTEMKLCPREIHDQCLEEIVGLGLKRIRLSLNEVELPFDLGRPELSIDPIDDNWITNFVDRGLAVTYLLSFWDKQYQAEGGELGCPRFRTEGEIQRYLDYVRFVVRHFKDRVRDFEIWNEPNATGCPQAIEAEDYINLVRRVVPAIRQEYPEARIVVGAVTWLHDPDSQEYMFAIVNSDIMAMVDAVSWHPFYGASPQYADVAEYYSAYPSLVWRIQDLASASGFHGEYRADEMTWRTPINALVDQPWTHSEIAAAKYYARAVVMHLGLGVAPGVMLDPRLTIISSTVRNLATIMAAAQPIDLAVDVQGEPTNVSTYSFALPDGHELIALWTEGIARDDDPGTEVTLVVTGRSVQQVIAIDVLRGFQQQLITNDENGDLVIPDLLISDYPIILRLIP